MRFKLAVLMIVVSSCTSEVIDVRSIEGDDAVERDLVEPTHVASIVEKVDGSYSVACDNGDLEQVSSEQLEAGAMCLTPVAESEEPEGGKAGSLSCYWHDNGTLGGCGSCGVFDNCWLYGKSKGRSYVGMRYRYCGGVPTGESYPLFLCYCGC